MPHVVAVSPKFRTVSDILGYLRNFRLSPTLQAVSEIYSASTRKIVHFSFHITSELVWEFLQFLVTLHSLQPRVHKTWTWDSSAGKPIKLINIARGSVGPEPACGTSARSTELRCSGRQMINLRSYVDRGVSISVFQDTHRSEVGK
jgi:hypothetical protein